MSIVAHTPPQRFGAWDTQMLSHAPLQQNGSTAQTFAWHDGMLQPGVA
jgi:hypothetical protein